MRKMCIRDRLCVNLLFLGGGQTTERAIQRLRTICEEAVASVMMKYESACAFAMQRGLLPEAEKLRGTPRVLLLSELEAMAAAKNDDFPAWKTAQAQLLREKIEQGELTLQNAVSYTHLDVYKRQAYHRAKARKRQSFL